MDWITRIVYNGLGNRLRSIDDFKRNPLDQQEQILRKLLAQAQHTAWGKQYGYSEIQSIAQFQRQVPLNDYEALKPWIRRMRSGEKDVLWPGLVRWFAKSSGTTQDKSKFIPVSKEALYQCHFRGSAGCVALYLRNHPESCMFRGKNLVIGGSHQIDVLNPSVRSGDLSAIMISHQPSWVQPFRTPKPEIALIPTWEEKLKAITPVVMKEKITSMAGVPSWNLVFLKELLEKSGKEDINHIWPSLELFIHGGIRFDPYREQFKKMIPSQAMHYMETYNASEGFFSIQDDPKSADMLLMLDLGIFFEFVPVSELSKNEPKVLTLGEVQTGENYALVITTNSGLWRYMIGDTVTFTSLAPYKIVITGRTRQFINAFGEELMVDNADKAIQSACEQTGAIISDYTAGPVFMDSKTNGAHEWLIEFEKAPTDLGIFTEILDKTLCSVNSDYEAKRSQNITLRMPVVKIMPAGTFYEWMKKRNKLGGQNKVPRLSNHREYIEEILNINPQ
ncbi:MAG: GH3 auxin-responsive promoter family protein [Bacteroidales bacterium]|nr:GH3 auxin-responsive promoter family protein [Bacteroidales bacterium]